MFATWCVCPGRRGHRRAQAEWMRGESITKDMQVKEEEEDVTRVGDFWGRCAAAARSAAAKTLPAGGQLDQPWSCGCSSSMLYSLRLAFLNFVLYVSVERAMRRTAAVAPAAATPQCSSCRCRRRRGSQQHVMTRHRRLAPGSLPSATPTRLHAGQHPADTITTMPTPPPCCRCVVLRPTAANASGSLQAASGKWRMG